jgi:heat shock protein HslJ
MNRRTIIPFVFVCVLTAFCAGNSPIAPSSTGITGTTWRLRSIQQTGSATLEIPNPDRFTVLFEAEGRLNVRADCNVCTGTYDLTDSALRLSALACTRAFCGTDSPDVRFLGGLQSSPLVATSDDTLRLQTAGGSLVFTR